MYHAMVALVSFVLMVGTEHPPSSRLRVLLDPGFNPILRSIMACTLVTSTVKTLWEKGLLGRTRYVRHVAIIWSSHVAWLLDFSSTSMLSAVGGSS